MEQYTDIQSLQLRKLQQINIPTSSKLMQNNPGELKAKVKTKQLQLLLNINYDSIRIRMNNIFDKSRNKQLKLNYEEYNQLQRYSTITDDIIKTINNIKQLNNEKLQLIIKYEDSLDDITKQFIMQFIPLEELTFTQLQEKIQLNDIKALQPFMSEQETFYKMLGQQQYQGASINKQLFKLLQINRITFFCNNCEQKLKSKDNNTKQVDQAEKQQQNIAEQLNEFFE